MLVWRDSAVGCWSHFVQTWFTRVDRIGSQEPLRISVRSSAFRSVQPRGSDTLPLVQPKLMHLARAERLKMLCVLPVMMKLLKGTSACPRAEPPRSLPRRPSAVGPESIPTRSVVQPSRVSLPSTSGRTLGRPQLRRPELEADTAAPAPPYQSTACIDGLGVRGRRAARG